MSRVSLVAWSGIVFMLGLSLLAAPPNPVGKGAPKPPPGKPNVAPVPQAAANPPRKPKFNQATPKAKPQPTLGRRIELHQESLAAAAKVDRLVEANYARHNVKPNLSTTDEQFVRRVYLDITGAIPTLPQTREFLDSTDPQRRAKLIQVLLDSDGHVSHAYNYWAGILRLQDRIDNGVSAEPFMEWLKHSLRENMPYDKLVRELLTAEGTIFEDPAAGYLLRDAGMPLDNMANTVRMFLGTRIGCAQCHDHPFDRWTQKEFYQMAAFTGGTSTRANLGRKGDGSPGKMLSDIRSQDPQIGNAARILLRNNQASVHDNPKKFISFPDTYHYDNGKPGQRVEPQVLFGESAAIKPENRREVFAQWLTSKENPRFALTIANRLWKHVLGLGQIEPVDDLRDDSQAENEPLMKFLADEMKRLDFDLQAFLRMLYNTKVYQRQAPTEDLDPNVPYHFTGPLLRRMSAEQAWDSFLTLAVNSPGNYQRRLPSGYSETMQVDFTAITTDGLIQRAKQWQDKLGPKAMREQVVKYGYKGQTLVRASELPQPAKADHFLRVFGQSDRELSDDSSDVGSVPQVLTMFNGPITHMMLEEGSVIYDNVLAAKSPNDRIDVIFLSVHSRKPTAAERALAYKEISKEGNAGYGNVIWALVNTREFLFIQ